MKVFVFHSLRQSVCQSKLRNQNYIKLKYFPQIFGALYIFIIVFKLKVVFLYRIATFLYQFIFLSVQSFSLFSDYLSLLRSHGILSMFLFYTVCPRSSDPFYIVSYTIQNGSLFLNIQYKMDHYFLKICVSKNQ